MYLLLTDIDWDTHSFIVCDVFVTTFILCIYLFQILPSCFLLGRPTSSAATRPTLTHLLSAARNEIQVRSVEFINFNYFKLRWICIMHCVLNVSTYYTFPFTLLTAHFTITDGMMKLQCLSGEIRKGSLVYNQTAHRLLKVLRMQTSNFNVERIC